MGADLFAGMPVTDLTASRAWYERLFGTPPAFLPNDVEAVWQVDEHGFVYIVLLPEKAGHSLANLFVGDYDQRLAEIAGRGIEPDDVETYENGVRKALFNDPDGNEIGISGGPADDAG